MGAIVVALVFLFVLVVVAVGNRDRQMRRGLVQRRIQAVAQRRLRQLWGLLLWC